MKIVFMGTPEFAVPSLEALVRSEHTVAGVITQPDRPRGRGKTLAAPPVKQRARELGLTVLQPEKLDAPAFLEQLRDMAPDLIAVVAFRILPPAVFGLPAKGTVNLHASLLPDYRGAAPIQWAVINGDRATGLTTFYIEENVDTGNILLQRKVEVKAGETSGELADRMKRIGADLLLETVDAIAAGDVPVQPQPARAGRRAPKLAKEDGRIHWREDAQRVLNRIRGVTPAPGAFTTLRGKKLKIHRAVLASGNGAAPEPGTVVVTGEGLAVACGHGRLVLKELQAEGKKKMSAQDFLRGTTLAPGEKLGN